MKHRIAISIILLTLLAACAAPVQEQQFKTFLTDYSNLERVDEQTYNFVSDAFDAYDAFIIEPVVLLFERPAEPEFSDEQIEDLKAFTVEAVAEALSKGDDGFKIVDDAGPRVGRIRIGITEIDETVGALNLSTYTKITGAGLGGVAVEGEIVDSVSGQQIGATVRWGSGSRIGRAGYTSTGDAKILIERWAKRVRDRLDEERGN